MSTYQKKGKPMKIILLLMALSTSPFMFAEENDTIKKKDDTEKVVLETDVSTTPTINTVIEFKKTSDEDTAAQQLGCIATGLIGAYLLWKSCDFKTRRIHYANEDVLQDFLSNIFTSHSIKVENGVISVSERLSLSKLFWMGLGTAFIASAIKCYFPSKKASKIDGHDTP